MERLTIPDVRVDEHTTQRAFIDAEAVREHAMEFYWRLKAYEDTSLSPEDCAEYKKFEDEIIASGKTFGRLIELLNADKDGRVVVLPCKVGDTAYYLNGKFIIDFEVIGYMVDERGAWSFMGEHYEEKAEKTYYCDPETEKIGKKVFLTRKEAEKALQEMQRKEDTNGTDDKPK